MCYAILPKEHQKEVEVPKEIESILEDCESILVYGEMLVGIPPMRRISHEMDLITRASFTNQEPYRMDPLRTIELNKQVKYLLEKGLIREILIPCGVPIILTPNKYGE